MAFSLRTWLRREAVPDAGADADAGAGAGARAPQRAGPRAPTPRGAAQGVALWLHLTAPGTAHAALRLAGRLAAVQEGQALRLFLSAQDAALTRDMRAIAAHLPDEVQLAASTVIAPPLAQAARALLTRWHPDLAVQIGARVDPAIAEETRRAGIPVVAIGTRLRPDSGFRWPWQRASRREELAPFDRVWLDDPESRDLAQRLDLPAVQRQVVQALDDVHDIPPCDEAERAALVALLAGRPLWLALDTPAAELGAVLDAQAQALRQAHRMLLILHLAPPGSDPLDGPMPGVALAALAERGWGVARRDHEEDPEDGVQVLLVDGSAELGLWLRLAPVCYMGGSLTPSPSPSPAAAGRRSPYAPAMLGAAVIHGGQGAAAEGAVARDYRSLAAASASRAIAVLPDLPRAVSDLMSPDRAAALAYAAWTVTTAGEEVLEVIATDLLARLRARRETETAAPGALPQGGRDAHT